MEAPSTEDDLWLARGPDVNPNRPLFTGDIFPDVEIPGAEVGRVMIIAHPCSMRGRNAALKARILVAPVRPYQRLHLENWRDGHSGVFPIPGVDGNAAVHLDSLGTAPSGELDPRGRIACLSELGVNLLQQRLVMRLTRVDIPTGTFHEAFSHTYEEADLLEEWTDILSEKGIDAAEAARRFEELIRAPREPMNLQEALRDTQQRAQVRREVRRNAEAFELPS